jgi:midasin
VSWSTVQAYINSITKDDTECHDSATTTTTNDSEGNATKRRRTDTTVSNSTAATATAQTTAAALMESGEVLALQAQLHELAALATRCKGMFEWQDGPLVTAMQQGHILLLDELSLAEDAVLERLNSVLEPSRNLVLAEKGGSGSNSVTQELTAVKEFCMLATMNPGGDFGKRELSPALRSRFTEIWVPAIARYQDLHAVLAQVLSSKSSSIARSLSTATTASEPALTELVAPMLQFVAWFNSGMTNTSTANDATAAATAAAALTAAPVNQSFQGSSSSSLFMSLRDMLAWANFIVDTVSSTNTDTTTTTSSALSPWLAYAHGAALVVLDGLGLGTGLSYTEVTRLRVTATAFLTAYIPEVQRDEATAQLQEVDVAAGLTAATTFVQQCDTTDTTDSTTAITSSVRSMFGAAPFYIDTGPLQIPASLQFSLGAPTTARNLKRVLRAMQLKKAILLEGSPGVGKTSLISALAAAAGHTLVRINLSEQTDLSDLMGSDLPIPDTTNDGDSADSSATTGAARFAWCDGVFLRALRAGHWVLLDELNLASQTVLEGLNACLDHRAEVFIPELGQSFKCPATFRVFAAQNPLGQGGGRKGMPKSFLNRFTKVFIDALTPADLIHIASGRFPLLAPPAQQQQHSSSGSNDDDDAMVVDSEQHSDGTAAAATNESTVSYIGGVATDHLLEKMIRFNRYVFSIVNYIYLSTAEFVCVRYTSVSASCCSSRERVCVVRLMRKTSLFYMTYICVTIHYQRE